MLHICHVFQRDLDKRRHSAAKSTVKNVLVPVAEPAGGDRMRVLRWWSFAKCLDIILSKTFPGSCCRATTNKATNAPPAVSLHEVYTSASPPGSPWSSSLGVTGQDSGLLDVLFPQLSSSVCNTPDICHNYFSQNWSQKHKTPQKPH